MAGICPFRWVYTTDPSAKTAPGSRSNADFPVGEYPQTKPGRAGFPLPPPFPGPTETSPEGSEPELRFWPCTSRIARPTAHAIPPAACRECLNSKRHARTPHNPTPFHSPSLANVKKPDHRPKEPRIEQSSCPIGTTGTTSSKFSARENVILPVRRASGNQFPKKYACTTCRGLVHRRDHWPGISLARLRTVS